MYLATEPKARAVVGDRQVVIHGLRHMDGLDRIAHLFRKLRHFQAGVSGIAATVVEKVADVMRLEHLDQALVLELFSSRLFILKRQERNAPDGVWATRHGLGCILAGVDQVFGQRADDPIATA